MAPNRETHVGSYCTPSKPKKMVHKPARLSIESLQRTRSDNIISILELSKEEDSGDHDHDHGHNHDHDEKLVAISVVEEAKCECCGMCEECTPDYINGVRNKFTGRLICGLCAEAVKEEMEKNGGVMSMEAAVGEHMSACVEFNRFGRTNPVLDQAQAMKQLLQKTGARLGGGGRAKSISPRDKETLKRPTASLARSSSCIPALSRDFNSLNLSK